MVAAEIERRNAHREWLRWLRTDQKHRGPFKPPCYKDCANCNLVDGVEDEKERRVMCTPRERDGFLGCELEELVGEPLPAGPGKDLLFCEELSLLPEVILVEASRAGVLEYAELSGVGMVKASRSVF